MNEIGGWSREKERWSIVEEEARGMRIVFEKEREEDTERGFFSLLNFLS